MAFRIAVLISGEGTNLQARLAQRGGGAAGRHELHAEVGQATREVHDARLVRDRQQGPRDLYFVSDERGWRSRGGLFHPLPTLPLDDDTAGSVRLDPDNPRVVLIEDDRGD